ncbi:MAG: hypothetical protein AB8B65_09010 [Kordia sp.]|uniref:hypothetical protein n=1 Tax=Kordia sp. TaxID=1965332 RepID=UPI00385BBBD0
MTVITFDTLEATKLLTENGFTKKQAEALVQLEKSKDTSQVTTKQDMSDLKIWVLTLILGQTVLIVGLMFTMFQFFMK